MNFSIDSSSFRSYLKLISSSGLIQARNSACFIFTQILFHFVCIHAKKEEETEKVVDEEEGEREEEMEEKEEDEIK